MLRQTIRKRLQAKLGEVKTNSAPPHDPVEEVGKWLRAVVRGHFPYYAVPMNAPALRRFGSCRLALVSHAVAAQPEPSTDMGRMRRLVACWLPPPRIRHPYPLRRLGVIT